MNERSFILFEVNGSVKVQGEKTAFHAESGCLDIFKLIKTGLSQIEDFCGWS
jgi:hypothetical protein